jgi:hypothetical protein
MLLPGAVGLAHSPALCQVLKLLPFFNPAGVWMLAQIGLRLGTPTSWHLTRGAMVHLVDSLPAATQTQVLACPSTEIEKFLGVPYLPWIRGMDLWERERPG